MHEIFLASRGSSYSSRGGTHAESSPSPTPFLGFSDIHNAKTVSLLYDICNLPLWRISSEGVEECACKLFRIRLTDGFIFFPIFFFRNGFGTCMLPHDDDDDYSRGLGGPVVSATVCG